MSSGFISEKEIVEARQRRQEEWDKVRTEDQPKEAPEEEPHDSRPLFQRLEEQRLKREAEFEETHKLKNMIRGLDDDEVGFLDLVERTKAQAAQQISLEEQREMKEFRKRVSTLTETEEMSRLRAQLTAGRPQTTTSKTNKLEGIVVRKRKASDGDRVEDEPAVKVNGGAAGEAPPRPVIRPVSALQCVGVLPGLGYYNTDSSSDSENSDESEDKPIKLTDIVQHEEGDSKKKSKENNNKEIQKSEKSSWKTDNKVI